MKIGIDARPLCLKNYTGISNCVLEIIKCWIREYSDNEYYLISGKPLNLSIALPSNWTVIVQPWLIDKSKLWEALELPRIIRDLKLDIYWGTNYTLPPVFNKRTQYFVSIYDLALLRYKHIGTRTNIIRVKTLGRIACKRSNKIFTISQASSKDIQHFFNIQESKIIVSYCGGIPSDYKESYDLSNVRNELIFDAPFFLFISTIEPRKNIVTIVNAFEKYIDSNKSPMRLVLAGKTGWECDEIYARINSSKYKDKIILPGFINQDEKTYLLTMASAFIYPSLYEGFGIPVLEAFYFNTPVITARNSSLPEVGGRAAFYIENVKDDDQLEQLMNKVISLSDEQKLKLNAAMKSQLSKFSWENNAKEIMNEFEKHENNNN